MHYAVMNTPIGILTVGTTEKGIASIQFGNCAPEEAVGSAADECASAETVQQLSEYFEGKRIRFHLPLDVQGTPFQKAVWDELLRIPYGETRSYGEIAEAIGRPGAARAVGMANHDNPIAVVIPCHRVVGKDGSLTGYAGGLDLKAQLLSIERQQRTLFT
jgi:methylated-DNA-[protein]-cysteine S-methyltransferase